MHKNEMPVDDCVQDASTIVPRKIIKSGGRIGKDRRPSWIKGRPKFLAEEDHRRTGRYVAGGTALAVMLLGLYHLFLRGASTIAGVCVPAIIMASYIIWVLYSARRDRRKALRYATAMQLTEVISVPSKSTSNPICTDAKGNNNFGKNPSNLYKLRSIRENPAFSNKDEN